MRVISQDGCYDFNYDDTGLFISDNGSIFAYSDFTNACPIAKYSSRQHALKAMEMLHNAYVGIIKGLNVDIDADTAEKIQEMMKTGYGMLIAKENYNGDRLEFYPMNTVFRFPADEDLEE